MRITPQPAIGPLADHRPSLSDIWIHFHHFCQTYHVLGIIETPSSNMSGTYIHSYSQMYNTRMKKTKEGERGGRWKAGFNCPHCLYLFARLVVFAMNKRARKNTCARVTNGGKGERGRVTTHHTVLTPSPSRSDVVFFSYHAKDHNNNHPLSHHSCL